MATLTAIWRAWRPTRRSSSCANITKLHEQQLVGTPQRVAARLGDPLRGEVCVRGRTLRGTGREAAASAIQSAAIDALLAGGRGVGEVARLLAARGLGDRREVYAAATRAEGARQERR